MLKERFDVYGCLHAAYSANAAAAKQLACKMHCLKRFELSTVKMCNCLWDSCHIIKHVMSHRASFHHHLTCGTSTVCAHALLRL